MRVYKLVYQHSLGYFQSAFAYGQAGVIYKVGEPSRAAVCSMTT